MKMLLVGIFALSCAQISNAARSKSIRWCPPENTTLASTKSTTSQSTKTAPLPPSTPYPSDDYYGIEDIETCGTKYRVAEGRRQFLRWVLTSGYCTLPSLSGTYHNTAVEGWSTMH